MEYKEQLIEWFNEYEEADLDFEDCPNKLNDSKQVSAIMFMASKLKDKKEKYFLHGEHDTIFIGYNLDTFEAFTEEDVKTACYHGVYYSEEHDGFEMYASM